MEITSPETISQELCALVHEKRNAMPDPPTSNEWDILEHSFWRRRWRDRNVAAFTYRVWIHTQGANLHPQGSCLNSAWSRLRICFPLKITHHPTRGRKICQRSASLWTAAHSSVALRACSRPAHLLLQPQRGQSMQRGHQERPSLGCHRDGGTTGWASASAQGCYPRTAGGRDHSGDRQLQRHWQPPLTGMKQKRGNLRNFPVSACNVIDLPRALGRHMCWLVAWATDGFEGEERARQRELAEHTRETTNHQLTWAPSWGTWWL